MADLATTTTWTCATCGRAYPQEFAVCPLDATPRGETTTPSGDALIGAVLGRTYRVVRVIGQGGMARLYEAEHLRIDARFAIKIIHDDLARDASLLARFEREARAAGKIRSEHVLEMVDVLRTPDDRPCIVTELLDGEDLQARLDRTGKLTVAEAIPIARQICRGVAAAHAVGVVHRDLKPSNVFLCKHAGGPMVKVFDFGIAKVDDDEKLTRTDAVIGTAAYMAPEQARRAADAGTLADVYSIGAIIYHMLAGEPPYGNVPAVSRFALLLNEEPSRPRSIDPTIPEGVEAVIQHAMAREPASRVASALELESQLAVFDKRAVVQVRAASEPSAENISMKARLTRPVAGFVAVGSSIGAGAWVAALLAGGLAPTSGGERVLLALIGLAVVAGMMTLHVRALRPGWGSGPAVARHIAPYARALLAGVAMLGALDLVVMGSIAVFHAEPLGATARLVVTAVAVVFGLGWRRWRLDDWFRRRIG